MQYLFIYPEAARHHLPIYILATAHAMHFQHAS